MRLRAYCVTALSMAVALLGMSSVRGDDEPAKALKRPAAKPRPAVKVDEGVKVGVGANGGQVAGEILLLEALAGPVVELIGPKLVIKNAPAAPAPNEAMIQQFVQQYRPILTSELAFVRQMVDLAPGDRPTVKAAGEASLLEAARQTAAQQVRNQVPGVRHVQAEPVSPRTAVRQGLEGALKPLLSPEQWKAFAAESEQRLAARKQAAILDTVARLDLALYLSEEQRAAVSASLTAGWQDRWEEWLMMYVYGGRYFPMIPDSAVVPHLTKEQRLVWTTLQKVNLGFYERAELMIQQDDWWGPEVAPPAQGNQVRLGIQSE